jgi:hypothetical protein
MGLLRNVKILDTVFWFMSTQSMASLQKVKAGRQTDDRLVESRRVNGKPRPVPLRHLGPADQLLHRLLTKAHPQVTRRSYQHGDVAALKAMADRLGLVALIERHCPTSHRPLSLGTTLVLAARNRARWPCATRAGAPWAQRPSVHRLCDSHPETRTRQYGWAQMAAVSGAALEAIEAELTRTVRPDLHLKLATRFDETSNFFPELASGNERSPLAQRGHAKQNRVDLRQVSRALVVTRDGQIPLDADVYAGHMVAATRFPAALTAIRPRVERLVGPLEDLTLVDDTGNHAKPNQTLLDQLSGHYVAALVLPQHPALRAIPTTASSP